MDSKIPTVTKDLETGVLKATLTWSSIEIIRKCEFNNVKDMEDEVKHIFQIIVDTINAKVKDIYLYEQVL